ncbi:MAG TPA: lysophospholipid acyltransferase family protein [Thermoanaerobaculaceae bacterium]|nr:lysophospholipid acyltransferase family protein [Thermoanaerobaculaceae bacterium]
MGERVYYLAGRMMAMVFRLLAWSWREEARGNEKLPPHYVLALWHGRLIGLIPFHRGSRCVTMASQSKDGALAAGFVDGLGMHATRGSASRGGREAFGSMERALRAGAPFAALTVDGPKGPWRRVKPGVLLLARRMRIPVVPVTLSCDSFKLLHSWDMGMIPKPFARVVVEYGDPMDPHALGTPAEAAERIGAAMDEITMRLDRELAGRELWPPRETLPPSSPSDQ